jgi:hypothetical protein
LEAAPPSFCLVTSSVANSSCHQQQQRRNRKRNNSFWGRQRRESESIQGEEKNRDWASLHREEEGPFLTPGLGTTAVLSLHRDLRPPPSSTAIPPPSTLPTPAEPEREKRNRTEPRERKPGEEKNHSGKKKNHRSSLEPAEPSANHHRSFLHPDLEPPSTKKEEETLLTERTKNRGRKQHSEAEERRRKTAASATVCHHRCPSRRPDHLHRRSAFLPPFFFFFFFPAVHCMNSGRELIHAHCSCSSGLRPRFFGPGLAQFKKLSKKIYFRKNL